MGVRAAASVFALALVGVTLRIAVAEPAKWEAIVSPEDGFSIDFPGKVVVSQDGFDAKKMVRHRQYLHDQGHTGWMVTATRFNPGRTIGDGAWLDLARDGMKGQCTTRDEGAAAFPRACRSPRGPARSGDVCLASVDRHRGKRALHRPLHARGDATPGGDPGS
jgi:hypothetical protein